jgi:hypothetical protein
METGVKTMLRSATARATTKLFEFMTHDPIKAQADRYINGAQDVYDLEFRQRQVDRGMFTRASR